MKNVDASRPGKIESEPPTGVSGAGRSASSSAHVEASAEQYIESAVKRVIARIAALPESSPELDNDFSALGLGSIQTVDAAEAIAHALGVDLGVEALFECTNVETLTRFIADRYDVKGRYALDPETELNPGPDFEEKVDEMASEAAPPGRGARKEGAAAPSTPGRTIRRRRRRPDALTAVVGMSGRFAGSPTVDALWENLVKGRRVVEEVRREGWDPSRFFDPDPSAPDRSVSKWGCLIEDFDRFDPRFFNISSREARMMEPRQRLFLEECFKALENAGLSPWSGFRGKPSACSPGSGPPASPGPCANGGWTPARCWAGTCPFCRPGSPTFSI